jgi:hypothetical protein
MRLPAGDDPVEQDISKPATWGTVILMGALLTLTPTIARGQDSASGTFHEVLESPPAHAAPGGPTLPGAFPRGLGGRLAQATEAGVVQGFGSLAFLTGDWEIHAQSRIPFDPATGFGVGDVSGIFIVTDRSGGVVTGKLNGTLDLSLLNTSPPTPLASTQGAWHTLGRTRRDGNFSGTFFLPFQVNGVWFYLNATSPFTRAPEPLLSSEFSRRGEPLVKLVLSLTP